MTYLILKGTSTIIAFLTILICLQDNQIGYYYAKYAPYFVFFTIFLDMGKGERFLRNKGYAQNYSLNKLRKTISWIIISGFIVIVTLNQLLTPNYLPVLLFFTLGLQCLSQGGIDVILKYFTALNNSSLIILKYQIFTNIFLLLAAFSLKFAESKIYFLILVLMSGVIFFILPFQHTKPTNMKKISLNHVKKNTLDPIAKFIPQLTYVCCDLLTNSVIINRLSLFILSIFFLHLIENPIRYKHLLKILSISSGLVIIIISLIVLIGFNQYNLNDYLLSYNVTLKNITLIPLIHLISFIIYGKNLQTKDQSI